MKIEDLTIEDVRKALSLDWRWVAMDKDEVWYVYDQRPVPHSNWWEVPHGKAARLDLEISHDISDWRQSLRELPSISPSPRSKPLEPHRQSLPGTVITNRYFAEGRWESEDFFLVRKAIPGGWLVFRDDYASLCFVPDPDHKWEEREKN